MDRPFANRIPASTRKRADSTSGALADERLTATHQRAIAARTRMRHTRIMATVLVFLLGVGNFALHGAVTAAHRPLFADLAPDVLSTIRAASIGLEFALLCGALYAAETALEPWLWAYAGYSLFNIVAAWVLIAGRL